MTAARRTVVRSRVPDAEQASRGGGRFAAYARLFEEAATIASTEAGYPPAWYERERTAWVIRRSTVECGRALAAGAELEITTWVADFRRVRSRRRYEARVPGAAAVVLGGDTDWVYVDRERGRPKRIPDAMMEAFVPGGAGGEPRDALEIEAPPAGAFVHAFVAMPDDVDALGHVNNTRSFAFLERAMAAARRAAGRTETIRAVRHDVEYLDEAHGGDELRCAIWRAGGGEETIETAAEITRAADGRRLTIARSLWRAD